jgi:formylglycine-generating enzyme required for sulfatase activity
MTALFGCGTVPKSDSLVALQLETRVNSPDGCVDCGCRMPGQLEPGTEAHWWLVFGLVRSGDENSPQTLVPASYCGRGPFQSAREDFEQFVGNPHTVADLAITARTPGEERVNLDLRISREQFSGFDSQGLPQYDQCVRSRSYPFDKQAEWVLPLLLTGERDTGRLGVHEVLVRLEAVLLGSGDPASFGALRVRTDAPGAEVLLNGEFAGRAADEPPLLLENVPAGAVEISVRDFSGRTAQRRVSVTAGEIAETRVDVLNLASREPEANGLTRLEPNPQGYPEYWRARDGALLVGIPAGEFLMGNDDGDPHETPSRQVWLSPFLIDKTEVTWRQFGEYLEATGAGPPREPVWGTPQSYPASLVNWQEAAAFCEWAGGRLPSEAEWEKAARGVEGRTYQWGNDWDPSRCNAISGGPHRPESAGSFPGCHSPYGVLDMAGSMWEWTRDWYQPDYYSTAPARDPAGPATGKSRAIRGGGWMTQPTWLRASYRFRLPPSSRRPDLGFRCAHGDPGR